MNTRQIDSILRSDPYAQSVFRGVCARDKLPQSRLACDSCLELGYV